MWDFTLREIDNLDYFCFTVIVGPTDLCQSRLTEFRISKFQELITKSTRRSKYTVHFPAEVNQF